MIKSSYEITAGEFNLMEREGKISQFKKWYNLLPVRFFVKRIKKELESIYKLISDNALDSSNINEIEWETKNTIKIHTLEICFDIIHHHFTTGVDHDIAKSKIKQTRQIRRKLKYNHDTLLTAKKVVKEKTGIEINDRESVNKLAKHIEHARDKHNEMFQKPEETESEKKTYMMDVITQYCLYMNYSNIAIKDITFPEFAPLKKEADRKIAAEKQRKEQSAK